MSRQEMLAKIEQRAEGYESTDRLAMLMDVLGRYVTDEQLQEIIDEQEIE